MYSIEAIELADTLFLDKRIIAEINNLLLKHCYINVLILAFLDKARNKSGKLVTSEFIWLKPSDRTLFYALNSLGRETSWVESIAVINHYEVEKNIGINEEPILGFSLIIFKELS